MVDAARSAAVVTLALLWVMMLTGGACLVATAEPLTLYVAPAGDDTWSGRTPDVGDGDGPFATLTRARDELRKAKADAGLPDGAIVEVAPGVYQLAEPLALGPEDSGTEGGVIEYRAGGGEVRIVGGKMLSGFEPVTDAAALARLDESARGKVMRTNLKAQGVTDFGSPGVGGLEVFFQDKPMDISRWPNEGFMRIAGVVGDKPVNVRGTIGDRSGNIVYEGQRPKRWVDEKDLWVHGYWFWDWSEQRHKVASIDTEKRIISVAPPYHGYGYRKGQWFYAFNALCELDRPGEWYLDRETGDLYFWPPSPMTDGDVAVSVLSSLVTMKDASCVTLRGFIFEAARGTAVSISGGTRNMVAACTLRNVGGWGITASGTHHGIIGCDIYQTGAGGISLAGGDRRTLTPGHLYAHNNHVHHYARIQRVYRPGITLSGVGNRASHNLIHNAPHMGMGFGGNDHVIEFNEIHSVCYESNDAGAIYTGRDWTQRGTTIRHNYMHHINGFEGRGCVGVYLDDMFSGTMIYGNVFYKVTRAAFIGGGRDCTIENNIFVECPRSIHIDSRAMGWAKGSVPTTMKTRLDAMPYKGDLWRSRYPRLVNTWEDEPAAPKGNLVARNVSVGERWNDIDGIAKRYVTLEDNLFDEDPHFADRENLNFQLRDDSPAYKMGFKRIPIDKIGVYDSPLRASWPVEHTVRPMQAPPAPVSMQSGPTPVAKVKKGAAGVTIDGQINAGEWGSREEALVIQEGMRGEKSKPASLAWIRWDDHCLFVAIDNEVDPAKPLRMGDQWGQDDAVEIAIRNPGAGKSAPILILRGFPSGHMESSDEAGAPEKAVQAAAQEVVYKAKVVDKTRWTTEWRIPFASLGIDPAKHKKLALNLSARKSAGPVWQMWQGTGGCTWQVDRGGVLELLP